MSWHVYVFSICLTKNIIFILIKHSKNTSFYHKNNVQTIWLNHLQFGHPATQVVQPLNQPSCSLTCFQPTFFLLRLPVQPGTNQQLEQLIARDVQSDQPFYWVGLFNALLNCLPIVFFSHYEKGTLGYGHSEFIAAFVTSSNMKGFIQFSSALSNVSCPQQQFSMQSNVNATPAGETWF